MSVETRHGVAINYMPAHEDEPGGFFYVSGEFWKDDAEATYDAALEIVAEAKRRGATTVYDDSEASCFFLNADTIEDAHIICDVLKDQGRIAPKPQRVEISLDAKEMAALADCLPAIYNRLTPEQQRSVRDLVAAERTDSYYTAIDKLVNATRKIA